MKVYLVGGAVRDSILGVEASDNDWVVVGSSPEEMIANGFKPIGKDFPVFLHPETNEEYALARTERKSGNTLMKQFQAWTDVEQLRFILNQMFRGLDSQLSVKIKR